MSDELTVSDLQATIALARTDIPDIPSLRAQTKIQARAFILIGGQVFIWRPKEIQPDDGVNSIARDNAPVGMPGRYRRVVAM